MAVMTTRRPKIVTADNMYFPAEVKNFVRQFTNVVSRGWTSAVPRATTKLLRSRSTTPAITTPGGDPATSGPRQYVPGNATMLATDPSTVRYVTVHSQNRMIPAPAGGYVFTAAPHNTPASNAELPVHVGGKAVCRYVDGTTTSAPPKAPPPPKGPDWPVAV